MTTFTSDWRGDIYPEILGSFMLNPHSSHMIRRSCFEAVGGFDTEFDYAVDWEMNIRLAKEYKFEYLPEYLVENHRHGENIRKADYTTSHDKLAAKYREERRQYPAVERAFRSYWHRVNGWTALIDGNRSKGVRHYAAAFCQKPSFFRALLVGLSVFGPRAFDISKAVRGAFVSLYAGRTVPDVTNGNDPPTATTGTDGGRRT